MYLRLITILGILTLSDALFAEIASAIGQLFGINQCPKVPEPTSTDETYCQEIPSCDASCKYRSYDGSCNNLKHPWWGMPYTPYKRLVTNTYSDGVHEFPKTKDNKDLPNAREMSVKLFPIKCLDDVLWTLGFMQYGQVTAHDISLTANVGQTGTAVACCLKGKLQEAEKTDPNCASILIPKSDPYYSKFCWSCINFYRTQSSQERKGCKHVTKVAEPLTAVTGFVDVSYLYGSSKAENDKVRKFKDGLLCYELKNGIEYLPQDPDPTKACLVKKDCEACYKAGDVRVNQNPGLAFLHNLYMYHHNYIARKLGKLNPHWDDEKIFQETRKITIAVHQNILYNEFIIPIIGPTLAEKQKVSYPNATDYINDYDPCVNPTPSVEYATGVFRFYHTNIQGTLNVYDECRSVNRSIDMTDWMLRPGVIEQGDNYAGMCRGFATQPQSAVDKYFPAVVKHSMFKETIGDEDKLGCDAPGFDLKAVDIMRGRDHGLATYAQLVAKCCLGKLKTWKDAEKFFSKEDIENLKCFYKTPEDIELVVGTSLEKLMPNALSGPVAACIIADQFHRTRSGDRYFFENEGCFTKEQLKVIRATKFADLLCLAKGVKKMQPRAMEIISSENPLQSCDSRKKFDCSPWKEDKKPSECSTKPPKNPGGAIISTLGTVLTAHASLL